MTARQQVANVPGISRVGVPEHVFLGLIWTGVSLSGLFLSGRLYSRFRGVRRLFVDDYLAAFAFLLVATTGALWQWVAAGDMYYVLDVEAGARPFAPDVFDRLHRWLAVTLVVELFFYTSLVAVKLSLLFFFRRLDANVNSQKWLWWSTLAFTLATYFISVGNVDYKCLTGSVETQLGYCNTPDVIAYIGITLKVNCVLDVFSEFLIMLQPIILLWNVRIRLAKKVAFIGLFSLSIATMAIATARAADIDVTRRPDGQIDNTYLWLWSGIEPPVAIMVSCLSAFPVLFRSSAAHKNNNKNKPFSPSETYLRMMSRLRSSRKTASAGKTDPILAELSMMSDVTEYRRMSDGGDSGKSAGDDAGSSSRGDDSLTQMDSRQPVLVPADKYGKPARASCYYSATAVAADGDGGGQDGPGWVAAARLDHITCTQQFGYKVTTRPPSRGV
ncbi:hypothetical protein B0T22DRAFT_484798 [Podospora appendiculata]|uniref:Rhodopsin domain-containing protein n=1 Tax=Podospora appendiculata TaxID=314037 RepID=A0AAE0X1L0_9PEZI|nr:hypothetical protein B0T22DRAFT_484798 [Podospora appendiculata]